VSQALHCRVVPLDETIALAAANVSLDHGPRLPDSACHSERPLPRPPRRHHPQR
jgi:hypothetical protein